MKKLLFFLTLGTLLFLAWPNQKKEVPVEVKPTVQAAPTQQPTTDFDKQLFTLTNQDRANEGKPQLKWSGSLHASALTKCNDMLINNYWSHDSPTRTWLSFFPNQVAHDGENLARNYQTPQEVEEALMNSPEHKSNILSTFNYFGSAECGTITVEHFSAVL